MGDWLFGSILTSIVLTLGWFFFTEVLPKLAARRATRRPEQPLTTLPGLEDQMPPIPVDVETQLSMNKLTHDRFLEEADELVLGSRSAGLFAENLLAEAAEKAGDAVKLRPGSFDANLMSGEIAVKRAQLAGSVEAVDLLERAAGFFATARETKKGVVDTYVGGGWANLQRAHRLEGEAAGVAYLEAASVFQQGFDVNQHNLFVLRGWGLAIDGLTRTLGEREPRVVAAEDGYRMALSQHRGGDHELHEWFAGIKEAEEPVRMEMPAVRDRH